MKLERVTIGEIVEEADARIRQAYGAAPDATPLADWIREEEARRFEAEEAFRLEPVEHAGVKLEVGKWYSILGREYGRARKRRHGCRYTGKRLRRRTFGGEELIFTFQAWGSKPDRTTYPRSITLPPEGLVELVEVEEPAGISAILAEREEREAARKARDAEWYARMEAARDE